MWRRGWSAGLGAAIPVVAARLQRRLDRPRLPPGLRLPVPARGAATRRSATTPTGRSRIRATSPRTSAIVLLVAPEHPAGPTAATPRRLRRPGLHASPAPTRGLFDVACPLAVPRDTGMSVLLTSPAFLLAARRHSRRFGRSRLVTGASIAVVLIAFVNLMHFSQGWVQFGYRFSNDVVPFALLLVALGIERLVDRRLAGACRSRWASSSCRSRSTPGACSGAGSSDGEAGSPRLAPSSRRSSSASSRSSRARLALMPGVAFWDTAELQAVAPLLGTAHPTGFPTYVLLGWLASVLLQPFGEPAFRMNLFAAAVRRVPRPGHRRPRPGADPSTVLGVLAGLGLGLTGGLGDRHPCGGARAPPRARGASLLCLLVGWEDRARDDDPGRRTTIGSLLVGRGRRLRAGGRQPLADPAAGPARSALFVSPSTARSCAGLPGPRVRRRPRGHVVVCTSSCRCAPGRSGHRSSTADPTPGMGSGTSPRPSSSVAALSDPFGDLPAEGRRARRSRTVEPFGPLALAPPARVPRHGPPATALRAADRLGLGDHVLLRRLVRQRRHRSLLPRALASSPGRGWRSWAPRRDGRGPPGGPLERSPADLPTAGLSRTGYGRGRRWRSCCSSRRSSPRRPYRRVDGATTGRRAWVDHALVPWTRRRHRELVELLDAAMVCTAGRGSAARHRDHRRPYPPR